MHSAIRHRRSEIGNTAREARIHDLLYASAKQSAARLTARSDRPASAAAQPAVRHHSTTIGRDFHPPDRRDILQLQSAFPLGD